MERLHSYSKDVNFSKIDEHANRATPDDARTFDGLVRYLKQIIQGGQHAQLLLARGLLAWIGKAQTQVVRNAPYNSPMNLIFQMVSRRVAHAHVLKTFCGYANIDCKIVTGRAKAIRYRAGDKDSNYIQGHSWNIFTADGQHHLLHPIWAVQVIIGFSHGDEMVVEADGSPKLETPKHDEGRPQYEFNEFWFCTHPKIFVVRCLPDQPENQLLSDKDTVNSVDEFLSLPDLHRGFYKSGLSLMTERSCRLKANKGKCHINLFAGGTKPNSLKFYYELCLICPTSVALTAAELPLLVLLSRNQDVFEIEIRFPIIGEYRFKLKVDNEDLAEVNGCCEFRIECNEVDKYCKRLPTDSGIEGYGFGPSAEEAGLRNPSESSGKIYVDPSDLNTAKNAKKRVIKYTIDDEIVDQTEFTSNLCSVDGKGKTVTHPDASKTVVDQVTCHMSVEVSVPEPGEYALLIGKKDVGKGNKSEEKPIAKYLVTTDKSVDDAKTEVKRRRREKKKEIKMVAKEQMKKTLREEYDFLQTEVDSFELPDDAKEEMKGARPKKVKEIKMVEKEQMKKTLKEEYDSLQTELDIFGLPDDGAEEERRRRRREKMKEIKMVAKEQMKKTLREVYDFLQTEVDSFELPDDGAEEERRRRRREKMKEIKMVAKEQMKKTLREEDDFLQTEVDSFELPDDGAEEERRRRRREKMKEIKMVAKEQMKKTLREEDDFLQTEVDSFELPGEDYDSLQTDVDSSGSFEISGRLNKETEGGNQHNHIFRTFRDFFNLKDSL